MRETISEALDSYNKIKQSLEDDIKEIKENIYELRTEVKSISQELKWVEKERNEFKHNLESVSNCVSHCSVCSNAAELTEKINAASTKATIAIGLNVALIVAFVAQVVFK